MGMYVCLYFPIAIYIFMAESLENGKSIDLLISFAVGLPCHRASTFCISRFVSFNDMSFANTCKDLGMIRKPSPIA